MSVSFSESLVKEYQAEMYLTYGVLVNDDDAQIQLRSLARSMFPIAIVVEETESREGVQARAALPTACAHSLSDIMPSGKRKRSRGSITPTSGQ